MTFWYIWPFCWWNCYHSFKNSGNLQKRLHYIENFLGKAFSYLVGFGNFFKPWKEMGHNLKSQVSLVENRDLSKGRITSFEGFQISLVGSNNFAQKKDIYQKIINMLNCV